MTEPDVLAGPSDAELAAIMAELDAGGAGQFPESALRRAQRWRAAITPLLIEALRQTTERARDGDIAEGNAHFFAVYLLTEFQAKEALDAFLDAVRLPENAVDELFSDAVTELFSRTLAIFAEDREEVVDDLIDDRSIFEYVRWAAASAYEHWVVSGKLESADALGRLRDHLRTAIERRDEVAADFLVYPLTMFAVPSQIPEIAEASALGLIDSDSFVLDEITDCESQGAAGIEKRRALVRPAQVEDTVEELRRWFEASDDGSGEKAEDWSGADEEYDEGDLAAAVEALKVQGLMRRLGLDADDVESESSGFDAGETIRNEGPRVGRNDPCPCGSGRKYKKCCGARTSSVG